MGSPPPLKLRLPATSANLGPGFDALGLAMAMYLTVEAEAAASFTIEAAGRNADICACVDDSLIVQTYSEVAGAGGPPLALRIDNQIPLGMGCGSSAAALLAGVLLGNHFGNLGWSGQQVLEEACRREGHPDNVAGCYAGGMTASASYGNAIISATCGIDLKWNLMLAVPLESLATEKARALLPVTYSRADAVVNVQNTALLVAAFALGRGDLLRVAMRDRLHQPYRMEACPLLGKLLPLVDEPGVLGVSLSGAGPSVLVIAEEDGDCAAIGAGMRNMAYDSDFEIIQTRIADGYTSSC